MLGKLNTDLLITLVLIFLAHLDSICKAENDLSLIKLPGWKDTSDYVDRCFYSQHENLTCDWTSSQTGNNTVKILASHPLTVTDKACLEFWHLASGGSSGATLRALLTSGLRQVEIWISPPLPRHAWRQVSVPLNLTEPGTQVIFEAVYPLSVDQTTLKEIGIRNGSCRNQCDPNTDLWTGDSTQCLCSVGQLFCFLSHCPKGQICDPQRDEPRNFSPSGICTIHSSTDCRTFDGALFRFTSPCTYVLAKTYSASEALPKFTVEVVNKQTSNVLQTTIQQINVNLGNVRVSLLKSQTHWVVVNGIWRKIPLNLNNGTIRIESNAAAIVVESSFGVTVSFDNTGALQLRIPFQYSDRVCGLCGNFNQLPGDDFLKPDGTKAESATALAKSWQTGGNVSSCEAIQVPQQCSPQDEAHYSSENHCGLLRSLSGPFVSCLADIGAESYFHACLLGLCSTHGDQKVLCKVLKTYADVCQEAGIAIPTWRNATFCSLECGENSHYNSCADGCPEVCSSLDQAGLCGSCEERCECNPGFKLSGDKCVPAEHCGCWYNGKHYERGGMTVEGDCVQQCQCIGNDTMQCTAMTCASDEVCKEKNGIKGCFPFKPATCSVYGDPHYITFDKQAYNFQGGCAYTLTTTCGRHSTVQFTVIGFNIHPAGHNFTRAKLEAVVLKLDGLDLTLNQSGQVDVHGVSVRLPYSTNGSYGSVWIYVKKDYIILETTFGLKLWLDRHSRLFLQVDERYKYELCGLCGTYSGYQEDDFMMPGGHIASESFEFGDSWRSDTNEECIAHPNDPRECDNDGTVANEECSMVFHGAFEACHEYVHPSIYFSSCVYDYCATSGDQPTFCESLKSYAAACQLEGVELSSWQTGTTCDFSTVVPTNPATISPNINSCPLNCSFDTSMCGWEQLIQDSFDWTRHSGSTPSNLTGPNQDHSTGDGFYMYLEGDDVTHGDSARLLSQSCQLDGPICFHFWYHMLGSATSVVLNVYQLQGNKATKVWGIVDNKGPEWQLGKADLKISGPFKLIIEGIRGSTAQSDLAIDDIAITSGSCSDAFHNVSGTALTFTTTEVPSSHQICNFDCSFQNGLCTWQQMITDAFDWERNNGSTPTEMTGPSSDHTGDGHYIYIESTNATYGDTARLISSQCSNTGPQCLQFWYHMYGSADTMGLRIYLLENKVAKAVWQKSNNHGNMWHLAQVDLNTTLEFQIILEGRRGSNDQSDVAIDDITLHHGRCSDLSGIATVIPVKPEFEMASSPSVNSPTMMVPEPTIGNVTTPLSVTSPTTTDLEPLLNGTAEVPTMNVMPSTIKLMTINMENAPKTPDQARHPVCHLDCDFEKDFCQWSQMHTDVFDWERRNGFNSTLIIGPLSDHTTGDGHYLHIDASMASPGHTARLIGRECSDTGPQCLTFWYHMSGSETMGLHVYLLQGKQTTVLWRRRNDQGNVWHLAQVDFVGNGTFQIILEGQRGTTESGVALDDIKLYRGGCQDLVTPATVAPVKWMTTNALEVPASSNETGLHTTTQNNATAGPQDPAPTNKVPSNETVPQPVPTGGPHSKTAQGNATAGPQVPATTNQAPSNETEPKPVPTGRPHPTTAQGNATAGPQVPAATDEAPTNETASHPTTAQGKATAGPQVPAPTNQAPSNETEPEPVPTGRPHPTTAQGNATAGTQVPATTNQAPSNETEPKPVPTGRPHPTTAQGNATAGTQVPAPTNQAPSNETEPEPVPTGGPHSTTAQGNATAGTQVPATTNQAPSNETEPEPVPTGRPHPTTAQGNATAGPQVTAVTDAAPTNETASPSPTAQGNATAGSQVPATTNAAPTNETAPHPTTAQGNATGPQVPAPNSQAPSNETEPQPVPTGGPHSPTAQGNATAGPHVPATTNQAPSNETEPQPVPTGGPHPTIEQVNATGPQIQATTNAAPSNETKPQPASTGGPHLTTAQGNVTAGPQVPPATDAAPTNETEPQHVPTGVPHPSTEQGNASVGPNFPAPTNPTPASETSLHPPNSTTSQTPEIPPTSESQVSTLRPNVSTNPTMRPHQTVPLPGTPHFSTPSCAENSHYTTCIPACSPTCKNLAGPPHCSSEISCASGCVCDDGFVQKGSVCVPVQKCGCIDRNGETHQFNEVWYTSHCRQKCECEEDDGEGKIDCKDEDGCEDDAVCLQFETGKYYCKSTVLWW
ncbi:LOW QUALITY PROTEIN: zonadhesin-like [Poeciliopsis prolifica]|uniref:LOW QUALITY PROTEIN: zonadhesin-like n=1 Tax=Poeciliopsis prolifica TaxID=188132 RepID=UPI002413544F|nr:LOW QUALITY PROTEIN: zonadhesin-like [Poeciliopsis prolifica]